MNIFITHLLIPADCEWNKQEMSQYFRTIEDFTPILTDSGMWITESQADKVKSCLDHLAVMSGFPEEERKWLMATQGLDEQQAIQAQTILDETTEYEIVFTHSWDSGELWKLHDGSSSYDFWDKEIGNVSLDSLPTTGLI